MERLDVVVFGATGFTGQYVVRELARVAGREGAPVSWGVAGRNRAKLDGGSAAPAARGGSLSRQRERGQTCCRSASALGWTWTECR